MRLRRRQSGQLMLIILGTLFLGSGAATGLFVSGKSIKSMRKEVPALQLDATRQQRVYQLLDQWSAVAEPATDEVRGYAGQLMELVARRGSTKAQFQQVMQRQRSVFGEAENDVLQLREELRVTLENDEWDRLLR